MGKADLHLIDLAASCFTSQLQSDLVGLLDPGGPYRMAAGLQSARGVDRNLSIQCGQPFLGCSATMPLLHKSQIFNRQDLSDGEAVVDLGDVDVLGRCRPWRRPGGRLPGPRPGR